jgi:hypothetical protein
MSGSALGSERLEPLEANRLARVVDDRSFGFDEIADRVKESDEGPGARLKIQERRRPQAGGHRGDQGDRHRRIQHEAT